MDYHSASQRKEILIHTSTRMNLEGLLLREVSQSQKDIYRMIGPTGDILSRQGQRQMKQKSGGQGLVEAGGEGGQGVNVSWAQSFSFAIYQ